MSKPANPTRAYKGSGVEWLGNIPEHWERCRLRNVVSEVTTGSRVGRHTPLTPGLCSSVSRISTVVHCNYGSTTWCD